MRAIILTDMFLFGIVQKEISRIRSPAYLDPPRTNLERLCERHGLIIVPLGVFFNIKRSRGKKMSISCSHHIFNCYLLKVFDIVQKEISQIRGLAYSELSRGYLDKLYCMYALIISSLQVFINSKISGGYPHVR